jgi:ribonuclease-3 family protein
MDNTDDKVTLLSAIDDSAIREMSALNLAYIGDTVYDLYIRSYLVKNKKGRVTDMHKRASSVVNARAQAQAALLLSPSLNERESDIFRLGKNAKSQPPRNMSFEDYSLATALETVIGYLSLTGQTQRLDELFSVIIAHFLEEEPHA